MNRSLIVILSIIATVFCHPTYYQLAKNETCQDEVPPHIHSYHIHVLFFGNNENSTKNAMNLRDAFIKEFNPNGTCPDLYHQDYLCMFTPNFKPVRLRCQKSKY